MNKLKILITLPSLKYGKGGVTHFYKSVLPLLTNKVNLSIHELGSKTSKNIFHPIIDQLNYFFLLIMNKYDLVTINPSLNLKSFLRDGLLIYIAKRFHLKVIVFFHGWDVKFENIVEHKFKFFFNNTYKNADLSIVLSSDFREKLIQWGVKHKIELLTTAVDNNLTNEFKIDEKEYDLNRPVRLLFLARIEKEKGIFEILEVFKILREKGYNVFLTIAGDGSDLESARQYAKENIQEDRFLFTGYILGNDKIKVFQESDIYCFPSYYGEGMPTSVLEAMAFGLPIITTDVGGLKDFFEDGRMGYICKTTLLSDITSAIEMILNNNSISDMSKYNHSYAKANFMSSVVADKLLNIYNKI